MGHDTRLIPRLHTQTESQFYFSRFYIFVVKFYNLQLQCRKVKLLQHDNTLVSMKSAMNPKVIRPGKLDLI